MERHKHISSFTHAEEDSLSPLGVTSILLSSTLGYFMCGAVFHGGASQVSVINRMLVAIVTFAIIFPLTLILR